MEPWAREGDRPDGEGPPIIGITCAYDPGRDPRSLRRGSSLFFQDRAYGEAVEAAGAVPVILPVLRGAWAIDRALDSVDGLIVSGGGGYLKEAHLRRQVLPDLRAQHPVRFEFEAALLKRALGRDLPVLGICRGHQMINRVLGGRNCRLIARSVPGALEHNVRSSPPGTKPVHRMRVAQGSMLANLLGTTVTAVNSLHRQAVMTVRPPLHPVAWAEDGVVEAVESLAHRFVLGLQFHPELLWRRRPEFLGIFEGLARAAANFRRRASALAKASPVALTDRSGSLQGPLRQL